MVLKLNKNVMLMALAITALLATVSCNKQSEGGVFELSKTQVDLVSAISENDFTITTESDWTMESSESWCVVTPTSGSGSRVVKVKATSANTASEDRKAVITVTVAGNKKTIDVVQKGFAMISVSISSVEVDYNTATTAVEVESSEGWAIVPASLPAWIKADKASTEQGGKTAVNFTLENNNTEDVRNAKIIFKINNKPDSATFSITQYTVRGNGRKSDSLALVAILSNIDQPAHQKNFDFTQPIEKWMGVTLSRFGFEYRVTGLNLVTLSSFSIPGTGTGMIPDTQESRWKKNTPLPNDIGYLVELRILSCGTVKRQELQHVKVGISGRLPESIGKLTKLKILNLQYNNFEGTIPSSMKDLTALTELNLYNNQFSGELPAFVGEFTNLRSLDCSYNQFTSIPNAYSKLQSLTAMDVSYQGVYNAETDRYESNASFNFPSSFLQLKKLDSLFMIDCGLTGELPATMGNMAGLTEFKAYNNDLSGAIPASLGQISRLGILNLANNKLTGSIPAELAKCQILRALFLGNNQLVGAIPDGFGGCPYLQILELYDNTLTGQITADLLRANSLYQVNVANNELEGIIPDEIANHKVLALLDISGNKFTAISDRISENTKLQFLLASDNLLTAFPTSLNRLFDVKILSFANNNITGTVPETIGNMVSLESLSINGNKLGGMIPANLLAHKNHTKFKWATDICPQQEPFKFDNCLSTTGRRQSAARLR